MRTSIYGIHPGVAMVQRAIAGLPEKTGRSLEEWVAFIKKNGPRGEAARSRIDLGLALGRVKTPKRLIDTGGFKKGDRITHRIEITALDDIDTQVMAWLKRAYEADV